MSDSDRHSRRDFLSGRGAAQTLADKLHSFAAGIVPATPPTAVKQRQLHVEATRRAMACDFQITYHQEDVEAAEPVMQALDMIEQLEAQLTVYRPTSEVLEINRKAAAGPVRVEPHLFALLQQCAQLSEATHGAFDFTSTPLSRVWGFLKRDGRLPSEEEIETALSAVDYRRVSLDGEQATTEFASKGTEINLNSIGKGYALDRIAASLDEMGVKDYLCHGGSSSVLARGENRSDAEHGWTVGLRHPLEPEKRIADLFLRNRALATAGGGTQFFEHEGISYSHVINPRTGWPVHGRFTATVLAPTAAEADALATALFVMELDEAHAFFADKPELAAVLVHPSEGESSIAVTAWGMTDDDWQLHDDGALSVQT